MSSNSTIGSPTLFHRIYKGKVHTAACLVKGCFIRILLNWAKSLKNNNLIIIITEPSYALMLEEFDLSEKVETIHVYRDYPSIVTLLHDLLKRSRTLTTYVVLDMNDISFQDSDRLLIEWTRIAKQTNSTFLFGISKSIYNPIVSLFEQSCSSILELHDSIYSDSMYATFYHTTRQGKQTIENLILEQDGEKIESISTIENSKSLQKFATFKVELTQQEQQERMNVELPFLKAQKETGPRTGLPDIIYYADKVDDIDEEDPDADLEF